MHWSGRLQFRVSDIWFYLALLSLSSMRWTQEFDAVDARSWCLEELILYVLTTCVQIVQTDRPVSAAVQTQQGLGNYQSSAYRDLVADAVDQINYDRNRNGQFPHCKPSWKLQSNLSFLSLLLSSKLLCFGLSKTSLTS